MTDLTAKYRPTRLAEIVGQSEAVDQLRAYVEHQDCPPALLFAGPSGTGKTSASLAFTRAINCESPIDSDACGSCRSCTLDEASWENLVCERLDASNLQGVQGVRDLRDRLRYWHGYSRFRFCVLDEAHGLVSDQAQDAMLRPLEEPGPNSRFILVTTAPEKLNAPIRTRVVRLDFSPVSEEDLVEHLMRVARDEGKVDVEVEVARQLARRSAGSPRVALKHLENMLLGIGPAEAAEPTRLMTLLVAAGLDDNVEATVGLIPDVVEGRSTEEIAEFFRTTADDLIATAAKEDPTSLELRGLHHRRMVASLDPSELNQLRFAADRLSGSGLPAGEAAGLCVGLLHAALSGRRYVTT